ncbi:MAG: glycosyltransferase family 4 protein [Actinomycetota bacterium]|nr:glycosyltransferase family 4 protein [Actinomycetota bacterium]
MSAAVELDRTAGQETRANDLALVPPGRPFKVAVFTTSYPRHADDFAGRFVSDAVDCLRARGLDVAVVSPGVYRTFGLSFDGGGIVRAVKRRPWLAPLLAVSMIRALRRAARDADLVHVHWLAGAIVARLATRKPFAVTIHGTISGGLLDDFKLTQRFPRLVRFVLGRARAVICVSTALGESVAACGVPNVVIPNGIAIPPQAGREAEPLEVFYTGRLSPEKGIAELVAATEGMNLVVSGDGPLRSLVPNALGFISRNELHERFARAAVVVCPSISEGFGVVCAEAMAHGKPVVASAVGGLRGLVDDERTGLLVAPGDVEALRAAIQRLLDDPELRARLGSAARRKISGMCGWDSVTQRTLEAYALSRGASAPQALPAVTLG